MNNFSAINSLFQKYLANECSPEEVDELISILEQPGQDAITGELLQQQISKELFKENDADPALKERLAKRLQEILRSSGLPVEVPTSIPTYEIKTGAKVSTMWRRWSVAASIIFIIAIGGFYFLSNKQNKLADTNLTGPAKDVAAPKGTKAVIVLADGSRIALDSLQTGALVTQGNVQVRKNAGGEIVYSGKTAELAYNTIYNPRGSNVIALTLSDGTQVWLNAESSMKYPTAFTGSERKVEITGEAYFEVAKDPKKKFIVTGISLPLGGIGWATEVLGTHFNVNSYEDESSTKITLLEGSVKVTKGNATGLLKPGQQAVLAQNKLQVISVDTEDETAWKNGMFQFSEESLESIMRKVSRWYDVDIEYADNDVKALLLTGVITHFSDASRVLRMLELTKQVRFKIDGKKIIVMKGKTS